MFLIVALSTIFVSFTTTALTIAEENTNTKPLKNQPGKTQNNLNSVTPDALQSGILSCGGRHKTVVYSQKTCTEMAEKNKRNSSGELN